VACHCIDARHAAIKQRLGTIEAAMRTVLCPIQAICCSISDIAGYRRRAA